MALPCEIRLSRVKCAAHVKEDFLFEVSAVNRYTAVMSGFVFFDEFVHYTVSFITANAEHNTDSVLNLQRCGNVGLMINE